MSDRSPWDAIVVGAGVAGLTAAWSLSRRNLRVLTVEADERVGGVVSSVERDGWRFELGPNTVLDRDPLPRILRELDLEGEVHRVPVRNESRWFWRNGRLHRVPRGPWQLLTSPLFSLRAKLSLLAEPWRRPSSREEESISEFVTRRLGREWLDTLVGPFVSGIYAGDPERLSARWTLGPAVKLESRHGSLIRGFLSLRRNGSRRARRAMISFPEGLVRLVERLREEGGEIRTGCRALDVGRSGGEFRLRTEEGIFTGRRLVVAVPAREAGALLDRLTEGESSLLHRIDYAPLAVVGLGFRRDRLSRSLEGTGFLVPRRQGLRILGCLCSSNLFPARAPKGHVSLTAFLGGALEPEVLGWDDDRLIGRAVADIDRALGIRDGPVETIVRRWPRAIPQYQVGHGRVVEAVESWEERVPGLCLAGSYLRGVAVPDSMASGLRAGELLADRAADEARRVEVEPRRRISSRV
ncbi:MAG: protoporphyrinogen oxidase [Thermoanaerobaculia bacterium]|nr:protoporphyrinogen oxidase [Thermoanaerobaculia bacterium]